MNKRKILLLVLSYAESVQQSKAGRYTSNLISHIVPYLLSRRNHHNPRLDLISIIPAKKTKAHQKTKTKNHLLPKEKKKRISTMPPKRPLPKHQPNPGERLILKNLLPTGHFTWNYAPLSPWQLTRTGDAGARLIEIHITNFRVANLAAAMANFPWGDRKFPIALFLVVDLTEAFSGDMEEAVEFIRTGGIGSSSSSSSGGRGGFGEDVGFVEGRGSGKFGMKKGKDLGGEGAEEEMRRFLFACLSVTLPKMKMTKGVGSSSIGERVLEFWEDVRAVREAVWDDGEMKRWVAFKYAVKRKMVEDAELEKKSNLIWGVKKGWWIALVVLVLFLVVGNFVQVPVTMTSQEGLYK